MNEEYMAACCDDICEDNDVEGACGCVGCSYIIGAAVAFGLMGMAEAIRENAPQASEADECNHCDKPLIVMACSEFGVFGSYCSPRCLDAAKARMARNLSPRGMIADKETR